MRQLSGVFFALTAAVGVVVSALTLLPRISVAPSDPVDSRNPLSSSFTIQNNNFIPLHHVMVMIGLRQINPVSDAPFSLDPKAPPARLVAPEWTDHDLAMDDKFSISLDQLFHAPDVVLDTPDKRPGSADLDIIVSYQPWFLPWTREKRFRFKTYKQTNGVFYWYSAPAK